MNSFWKLACVLAMIFLMNACTSGQRIKDGRYAEVDAAMDTDCNQPSVRFHKFRNHKARNIRTKSLPIRVPPGSYLIGVSCASIYRDAAQACVKDLGKKPDASVPPYRLVLKVSTRYVFSCNLAKSPPEIRITESTF